MGIKTAGVRACGGSLCARARSVREGTGHARFTGVACCVGAWSDMLQRVGSQWMRDGVGVKGIRTGVEWLAGQASCRTRGSRTRNGRDGGRCVLDTRGMGMGQVV